MMCFLFYKIPNQEATLKMSTSVPWKVQNKIIFMRVKFSQNQQILWPYESYKQLQLQKLYIEEFSCHPGSLNLCCRKGEAGRHLIF